MNARSALHRVSEGYVRPEPNTHEGAAEVWTRLVARGRIVERRNDGERSPSLRVHLAIVEHPDLPPAEVYALFWMGDGSISAYRCLPEDARDALRDSGCFNL